MYAHRSPKLVLIALLLLCLFPASIFSQNNGLQMKLQLLPDGGSWGVYVKPVGVEPSGNTITASGLVSIVMPNDFEWQNFENHAGKWEIYLPVDGDSLLPNFKLIGFALDQTEPLYPIPISANEETLLFSFSATTSCPDTLFLIDCVGTQFSEPNPDVCILCPEHPDHPCHGIFGPADECMIQNPRNDLQVLDLGASPPQQYNYEGNYDLSAWNCNDCDGDGILDAFDDEYACQNREKLNLKLIYNSPTASWSIKATPGAEFFPSENSTLESATVTIASSDDFTPIHLQSLSGGDWELTEEYEENGTRYFTFELQADLEPIAFENGEEVQLFKFKNELGICPESLSILEGNHPLGLHGNALYGTSMEGSEPVEFDFGEIYGPNAWICEILPNGGFGLDSLGTSNPVEKMFVAPNPTSDFVNVKISTEDIDNQSIVKLTSLQGRTLQTHLAEGQTTLRMDLNDLPAGLYFLVLEREGQAVQWEKLIKE